MKDIIVSLRNGIGLFVYKNIFRHVFFLANPESIHDRFIIVGVILGSNPVTRGLVSLFMNYSNERMLSQKILGIEFINPVGLAAGFDKNGEMISIMPCVGFGFVEIGSITAKPYTGNKGTKLWRLKKSKSLIVYYGLKNIGVNKIIHKLKFKKFTIPLGINIAKTNCKETCDIDVGIADYIYSYKKFNDSKVGSYFTINISCPNVYGGEPFTDYKKLNKLLKEIFKIEKKIPIFVKISPDLNNKGVDNIIKVCRKYKIDGFIISNLTKNRDNIRLVDKNVVKRGGISGKVVERLSNNMIEYIYKNTQKQEFVIIGCGGISCGKDAYKKIKRGASLVQLITGMIYEGPMVVSQINLELCELLRKDGFKNVRAAVGSGIKR